MTDTFHDRTRNRGQAGFTLIELLVVVAILAILAGVAVFAVNGLTNDADNSACKVEADTVKTANAAANATSSDADDWTGYIDNEISTTETKYYTVTNGGTGNSRTVALTKKTSAPAGC